ncbi:WD40-repeat-containing domain protein, partial [Rhizoctonia solani]
DGLRFATGCSDHTVRVWNATNGTPVTDPLHGHTDTIDFVVFSPDGLLIALPSRHSTVHIWIVLKRRIVHRLLQESGGMRPVFSPDGLHIAVPCAVDSAQVWDIRTSTPSAITLNGDTSYITVVAFTPDGSQLITGSSDCIVCILNLSNGELLMRFVRHPYSTVSLAVSLDGRLIAYGSGFGTVLIWDIDNTKLVGGPLIADSYFVSSVHFSSDNTRVISRVSDRFIHIWNVRDGMFPPAHSAHALVP